jgi:Tol biopolymer transport system component
MMKVDAEGGTPFTIADVTSPRGGAWNTEGTIIYAPDQAKGLYRVPAAGGKPVPLTQLDTTLKEITHRWPVFLPDNDHYLFFARGSLAGFSGSEKDHIYAGSLSKGTVQQLFPAVSEALYADGMILFTRENSIIGQAFDPVKLKVSGDPVTIAQDIQYTPRWSRGTFSVSQNGLLAFLPGGQESRPDIILVRKDGSVISHIGRLDVLFHASISPDGKRLAMDLLDSQSRNIDVWIYDTDRGIKTRLTFSKEPDLGPIWSPRGDSVAYINGQGAETKIMIQQTSGSGQEAMIAHLSSDAMISDWSSDGKYLLYSIRTGANNDIWLVPLTGDRKPIPVLESEYNEVAGKFSPDIRWIAYVSDESGKSEIYVRSFAPPGTAGNTSQVLKRQISVEGGTSPVWRSDGKAIFYVTPRGIMLAELNTAAGSLEITRVSQYSPEHVIYFGDIHSSGNIIVTQTVQVASGVVPLNLVVNWKSDLVKNP